jgi:hypothetical protein
MAAFRYSYDELKRFVQTKDLTRTREALTEHRLSANYSFECSDSANNIFQGSNVTITANLTMTWSESLLEIAIRTGSLPMVQLLIEHGADLEQLTSAYHCTALMLAIAVGQEAIAGYLISKGANVNFVLGELTKLFRENTFGIMPNACGINPATLDSIPRPQTIEFVVLAKKINMLHLCAIVGASPSLVQSLIARGAKPDAVAQLIARTPGEHLHQSFCTNNGIGGQVAGLATLCLCNLRDLLAAVVCPGIHSLPCMHPYPVDVWEHRCRQVLELCLGNRRFA